jgi:hypothetical protein
VILTEIILLVRFLICIPLEDPELIRLRVDLTQTAEFHAFDHVTVQFTESIPPLRLHSDKLDLQLMMVHTVACASVVVVLGLAANDGEAMRKAKEAALRVVSMAKASLAYRGVGFLPPVVGVSFLFGNLCRLG